MRETLSGIRVVLIETSHPGNIGAAARAMKVMGLSDLRLVAPKSFPHAKATALAASADDLLQRARVHDSLDDALEGCRLVLGTSARLRALSMAQMDARAAAVRAVAEAPAHPVAILFGQERIGLTNAEMRRCHYLVHIPSNPDFGSLNLAQAVQVICYELHMAVIGAGETLPPLDYAPAADERMEVFYQALEQTLTEIGFFNPGQSSTMMLRLRRLFQRARPDDNEINILMGILSDIRRGFDQA